MRILLIYFSPFWFIYFFRNKILLEHATSHKMFCYLLHVVLRAELSQCYIYSQASKTKQKTVAFRYVYSGADFTRLFSTHLASN